MNQKIAVDVVVLRHNSKFLVLCEAKDSVAKFRGMCRRYSKIPLGEFCLVCEGLVVDDNLNIVDSNICQVKKVFVFAKSLKQTIRIINIEDELVKQMASLENQRSAGSRTKDVGYFDDFNPKRTGMRVRLLIRGKDGKLYEAEAEEEYYE